MDRTASRLTVSYAFFGSTKQIIGVMEFPCLLHHCGEGKELVSTSLPLAKAALTLTQEDFSSGLLQSVAIEDSFGEDLARGIY